MITRTGIKEGADASCLRAKGEEFFYCQLRDGCLITDLRAKEKG